MADNGNSNPTGAPEGGYVRRRNGISTLGQSINRITTPAMRRRGFAEAAIVTHWEEIVGRPLCDHSRPIRVVFPRGERRGGTLHLTVSGAFAPEVQHLSPQIIDRINGYFGYAAVGRLELHHGRIEAKSHAKPDQADLTDGPETAPDPKISATIESVEDEPLRTALDRLARLRAKDQNRQEPD